MRRFFVFLTVLFFVFSFIGISLAQQNEEMIGSDAVLTKRRPTPIPREYVVEDYLPILGKQMRQRGIPAAKPFFIAAIYYHMEIPQTITNAKGWGFLGLSRDNAMSVRMENAKVITNSYGFRAGINLLPFMSVFGVYMHTDVTSKFTAVADGNELMPRGYMLENNLKVKADTGAIGVAFQYGFRAGPVMPFGVINANYAWSFTDMTDDAIESLILGARVGVNVPLPKRMMIAAMFGFQYMYMPMGNQVGGSYDVALPPGTIGKDPTMQSDYIYDTAKYSANAEYASPWTLNAGIMFQPIKYFNILAEIGFFKRLTAMVALQANF